MNLTQKKTASIAAVAIMTLSVFATARFASAQAATDDHPPADPKQIVGEWTVAIDGFPGGPQLGDCSIKESGGEIKATLQTPLGEVDSDSVTVEGQEHVMIFFLEAMGQEMDVEVRVTVDGNTNEGTLLVGGGMMEADIKGAKKGSKEEADLKKWVEEKIIELIGVPELPIEKVKSFVGEWNLMGEGPMGEMEVEFHTVDVDGKASAKLMLPPPLGTQTINRIEVSDSGAMVMSYPMELMGQEMDFLIELEIDGPLMTGLIDVGDGMFQIPLEGVKKGRGISQLNLGGKNIWVEYGRPSTSGGGYKQIATVKDGFIWRMGSNAVTSLKTDAELTFGDVKIPAGHYSLRAKKAGSGWHLVFNSVPEGPGHMHDKGKDIAEVPLTKGEASGDAELLTLKLSQSEGKGKFTLEWGEHMGSAEFTVPAPPPAQPQA